jgi:hypothetical protein
VDMVVGGFYGPHPHDDALPTAILFRNDGR